MRVVKDDDEAELQSGRLVRQRVGLDTHSLIANPQFAEAEEGDYHLKSTSPAYKLGFKIIPIERIGLEGYRP